MPALTAAELAAMRSVEAEVMSSTCVVQRYTTTGDDMGGYRETWAAVGTVSCDAYPQNQRGVGENLIGEQETSLRRWFVTVPTTATVTMKDRLLIDGRTFEVVFVPNTADHLTALQIEAVAYNEEQRI